MSTPIYCEVVFLEADTRVWTKFITLNEAERWAASFTKKWTPNSDNKVEIKLHNRQLIPIERFVSPEEIYMNTDFYIEKNRARRQNIKENIVSDIRRWWSDIDNK